MQQSKDLISTDLEKVDGLTVRPLEDSDIKPKPAKTRLTEKLEKVIF